MLDWILCYPLFSINALNCFCRREKDNFLYGKQIQDIVNSLSRNYKEIKSSEKEELLAQLKTQIEGFCNIKTKHFSVSLVDKLTCSFCRGSGSVLTLRCGHRICKACMIEDIKTTTHNFSDFCLEKVKCRKCSINMTEKLIFNFYTLEELKKIKEKSLNAANTFTCCLCGGTSPLSDCVCLIVCGHNLHKSCLIFYLETKINLAKVSKKDLCCPMKDCGVPISTSILNHYLSSEMMDKLTQFWLKNEFHEKNNIYKSCRLCNSGLIIPEKEKKFKCNNPDCELSSIYVCVKCEATPYHEGKTCEEYRQTLGEDEQSKAFERMKEEKGFRACPKCNTVWGRDSGCNCMTCKNPKCEAANGTVCFCYLCGDIVKSHADYDHYPGGALFGNTCNTLLARAAQN